MSTPRIRSSVARMHAYVPGEQPRDPAIVKLNTNENPYPPSPRVAEALRALSADSLRLYPDPACTTLRREIAALHGTQPDQILVGNGSDEVLALALRAFVEHTGAVGYFVPSYSLYPVLAAIEDVRTYEVELTESFGWVEPDPEEADLFFITNPNAPTSLLHPREAVQAFCRASRGVVLIDEAYADFARAHCVDLALSTDNVLVTRSLSKSYGLAGLRVGYAIGPAPLIGAMAKIKDSYNLDAIAQALALSAIQDQAYMRERTERICSAREEIADALRARGFHVFASETNFLWVRPGRMDAPQWFQALRERKMLVRHFSQPAVCDFLRITIGDAAAMEALIQAVDEILGV